MYKIWDTRLQTWVGNLKGYRTRKAASRVADRFNLEYGAHRYNVSMCF